MHVIICGAGQVGLGIAERLAAEGNDVAVIDSSPELVQRANDMLDVRAIHGNGAHPDVLARADASDADMLIAVTFHDEVNMVACQVGGTLFDIPTKIARVRAQSYLDREWAKLFSHDSLGIDYVISPEIEVGNVVLRRLQLPGAFDTANFAEGRVMAVGITCGPECPIVDTPMAQLASLFPDLPAVAGAVIRQGELLVPHGEFRFEVGDDVYVILPSDQVPRIMKIFGQEQAQARRIIIAGGGNIGLYVARAIEEREPNVRAKILEGRRERAIAIADMLDRTVVLNGNALSEELLKEADIDTAETLVAVTNDDQANLLTSVLAKQLGCRRSLCLLNSAAYTRMIRSFGIDAHVNPRAVTVSRILQFVRRGRIRGVHAIHNGAGELIEADALETMPIVSRKISELDVSDGIRFGCVVRQDKVLPLNGDSEIKPKDRVVLFAKAEYVKDVEQLFRVSPDYF